MHRTRRDLCAAAACLVVSGIAVAAARRPKVESAPIVIEAPAPESWFDAFSLEASTAYLSSLPRAYARWWLDLVQSDPGHVIVETTLIIFILYILFIKKTLDLRATAKPQLSKREINELIDEWQPEPLVPPLPDTDQRVVDATPIVERVEGPLLRVQGREKPLLNMVTFDFLGMGQQPELKAAAEAALNKYGCGSCGPRGFYGTVDVHLHLEEEIAAFMGTEAAIMYSDSATTVSSAIPAFAKRGDLIVLDDGCEEPVFTGVNLSRSTVRTFRHNDVADLERVLSEIRAEDRRLRRNVLEQRRFIVVEGLYRNHGDVCPLPELVKLKSEYKYRLVVDESMSVGVLGATGRGVTEHFKMPLRVADIVTLSLAHALGSVGGLCVGSVEVIDHQRLSAAGYCFSASAPPFLSASASAALRMLREQPTLLTQLAENSEYLWRGVNSIQGLKTRSWEKSPLLHVVLADSSQWASDADRLVVLGTLAEKAAEAGVAVAVSRRIHGDAAAPAPPTLRLTANARHTRAQLDTALAALRTAAKAVLK